MIQRDARLWDRLPACQRCNRSDCQCRQAGCLSHFDLPASRRDFLRGAAAMSALAFVGSASGADEPPMSLPLVGYNEHRTNLPRGEARQCQHESGDGREGGWHRPAFDRLYWLKTLGFIPEDCGADIDSLGRSFLVNGSRHDLQEEFWLAANDERALVHHDALLRSNGTSSATC